MYSRNFNIGHCRKLCYFPSCTAETLTLDIAENCSIFHHVQQKLYHWTLRKTVLYSIMYSRNFDIGHCRKLFFYLSCTAETLTLGIAESCSVFRHVQQKLCHWTLLRSCFSTCLIWKKNLKGRHGTVSSTNIGIGESN